MHHQLSVQTTICTSGAHLQKQLKDPNDFGLVRLVDGYGLDGVLISVKLDSSSMTTWTKHP